MTPCSNEPRPGLRDGQKIKLRHYKEAESLYGRLMSCTRIRHSIGTENLVPEEVNYTKIAIRVTVMNKVQFLLASEPRKPLKPRSLYVIFLVEKNMRVKRRRACDCRDHKKI